MNSDILLIEDRINRKEQYIKFDLDEYTNVDLTTGENLTNILNDITHKNFLQLEQYKCLIFHASALSNIQKSNLKAFCQKNKKSLVFFSGGISTSYYNDNLYPFLSINSKIFYSHNLKKFLNENQINGQINLLILQYGERWLLSSLLNLRNNLIKTQEESGKILVNELKINDYTSEKINIDWLSDKGKSLNELEMKELKNKIDLLIFESM
ncbi:hypothetical protein [Chryseobacterium gregarium]|uniref:hypothetical protein n=1 Tax=Chryseobacterium gregarium TaxID=456299 RepID=UPI000425E518|nr:hypothetical protein [Chryseobacterium gregarium]